MGQPRYLDPSQSGYPFSKEELMVIKNALIATIFTTKKPESVVELSHALAKVDELLKRHEED